MVIYGAYIQFWPTLVIYNRTFSARNMHLPRFAIEKGALALTKREAF
jgi:hypothetical protein